MSTAKSFRQLIGVPPSTASPLDSTLIIIDAQNEYQDGQLKTENIKSTRAAIGSLLEKYRAGGKAANIVHVTHATPSGAPVFTPDTPLAEEFSELKPKEGEHVIKKNYPSSFAGTDLEEYLKKNDAKKVVLAGYMGMFLYYSFRPCLTDYSSACLRFDDLPRRRTKGIRCAAC